MSIILTNQTAPTASVPPELLGTIVDTTVPHGGIATTADEVLFAQYATVKWFITAVCGDRVRFFELSASCHHSRTPIYTVFGDVGDRVSITVQLTQVTGKITLSIINNEVSDVSTTVVKAIAVAV